MKTAFNYELADIFARNSSQSTRPFIPSGCKVTAFSKSTDSTITTHKEVLDSSRIDILTFWLHEYPTLKTSIIGSKYGLASISYAYNYPVEAK